jgi:hypothetical protein
MTGMNIEKPPVDTARIRFTAGDSAFSNAILFVTDALFCHSEAVMADGTIMSALADGSGVRRRPNDASSKADVTRQQFVDLKMSHRQYQEWEYFLWDQNGKNYDTEGMDGELLHKDWHSPDSYICSALMITALQKCKWLPSVFLCYPIYKILPCMLLLGLEMDPRSIIYPIEYASA